MTCMILYWIETLSFWKQLLIDTSTRHLYIYVYAVCRRTPCFTKTWKPRGLLSLFTLALRNGTQFSGDGTSLAHRHRRNTLHVEPRHLPECPGHWAKDGPVSQFSPETRKIKHGDSIYLVDVSFACANCEVSCHFFHQLPKHILILSNSIQPPICISCVTIKLCFFQYVHANICSHVCVRFSIYEFIPSFPCLFTYGRVPIYWPTTLCIYMQLHLLVPNHMVSSNCICFKPNAGPYLSTQVGQDTD